MSHVATNKVKGDFYCTGYFLLFVLVSFMGLFRIPKKRPNSVPRFVQEISVVEQYWLRPLAAAFEDIFNNFGYFMDSCPVSGSEDNAFKNAVCVCAFSPILQFKNIFFLEKQKCGLLWECALVRGIDSFAFSNYRKDY